MKTIAQAYKDLEGDLNNVDPNFNRSTHLHYDSTAKNYFMANGTHTVFDKYIYICTRKEFNNYKEENMKKTVRDAVIKFRGDKPDSWFFAEDESGEIIGISYYTGGKINGDELAVCSAEQFNTCVDLLASNMGRATQTYTEYKLEYSENMNESLTKGKPAYTQAMCDKGELPSVGMEYLDDDGQLCVCLVTHSNFVIGEMIEHPSTATSLAVSCVSVRDIKPLTPPIELIDGERYEVELCFGDYRLGYWKEERNSFFDSLLCGNKICGKSEATNIKHLIVEVK